MTTSTVSATFVNETAARLFADWWHWRPAARTNVTANGCTVTLETTSAMLMASFRDISEAFNAAAQHAAEIAEGGSK